MPAAGWAPRPLCGKCFHWKTSPPTECLQTQLLSSKAASTTDWDPFLMQIHIILLGNSRCSAMLFFRKIRTLLAPPSFLHLAPVSSHLGTHLGASWTGKCKSALLRNGTLCAPHQKTSPLLNTANPRRRALWAFLLWWAHVLFPMAWPSSPSVTQREVKIQGKHFTINIWFDLWSWATRGLTSNYGPGVTLERKSLLSITKSLWSL